MTFRRPGRTLLLLMLCLSALAGCRTWSAREERAAQAYNRGNSLREAGRYEEAAAAYRDALAEAPEFRAASFNLALVLAESGGAGDAGESLQILEDLRSRDPRNLMILNALAWAAWNSGNPELWLE